MRNFGSMKTAFAEGDARAMGSFAGLVLTGCSATSGAPSAVLRR